VSIVSFGFYGGFFGLADAAMTCVDVARLGGWAFEEVQGGIDSG
jgi:hypothetical protein